MRYTSGVSISKMVNYKCPKCSKELSENDLMRGICPSCHNLFDFSQVKGEEIISKEPTEKKIEKTEEHQEEKSEEYQEQGNGIKEALKYSFTSWKRLFIFWWILVPILGILINNGYIARIVNSVMAGEDRELPEFGDFNELLTKGFFLFLIFLLWGLILQIVGRVLLGRISPYLPIALSTLFSFVSPLLVISYASSGDFSAGFRILDAFGIIFSRFGEYLITWLKVIALVLILLVASAPVITIVVTLPAMTFGSYYLFAKFAKSQKG